ncbi:MAG TPA: LacI family DNA-binding transcriptional regulator [Terrimesophilobacter sp.]|nr:LacI family DNA-binding transcriptional regulator [Terrimesophilobacter sp.]
MTAPAPRRDKPATIYDVARLAQVSHQTVALILQGRKGFRPQTRERVEQALKELNYRPNFAAKSLARSKSHRIGALVYELLQAGPSKTIHGASQRARAAGFLLDIVSLDPTDEDAVKAALSALGQQDLAGVLAFAPVDLIDEEITHIPFGLPFLAEREVEGQLDSEAGGINGPGLRLLVDHLAALGHRRFFTLAGPDGWIASRNRTAAYEAAVHSHGGVSLGSIAGDWSSASGYAAALRVPLDRGITAVVAANDQMALGALLALSERGVRVPEDISVTGFDDIPEAAYYRPPLTTVHVDYDVHGAMLVDRLLTMIGADLAGAPVVPGPLTLQVRASTSTPSGSIRGVREVRNT